MPYIVRVSGQAGESDWSFDDALDVAEKASELCRHGVRDIVIEAPGELRYRDDELGKMLSIAEVTD